MDVEKNVISQGVGGEKTQKNKQIYLCEEYRLNKDGVYSVSTWRKALGLGLSGFYAQFN